MTPRLAALAGLKLMGLYILLFYLPPQLYLFWLAGLLPVVSGQVTDVSAAWLFAAFLAVKLCLLLFAALTMCLCSNRLSGWLIKEDLPVEPARFRHYLRSAYLFLGVILLLRVAYIWMDERFAVDSGSLYVLIFQFAAGFLLIFSPSLIAGTAARLVGTNPWHMLMRLRARQQKRQD